MELAKSGQPHPLANCGPTHYPSHISRSPLPSLSPPAQPIPTGSVPGHNRRRCLRPCPHPAPPPLSPAKSGAAASIAANVPSHNRHHSLCRVPPPAAPPPPRRRLMPRPPRRHPPPISSPLTSPPQPWWPRSSAVRSTSAACSPPLPALAPSYSPSASSPAYHILSGFTTTTQ
uniref:Uncharacterized protein n=1 Tax=Oryza nivara TaxID=4536 RepID=A0A0E0HN47_ORYNI